MQQPQHPKLSFAVFATVGALFILGLGPFARVGPVSPKDLLLEDGYTLQPPARLTPDQLREDLAVVSFALEHGYGGRAFVPQEKYAEAQSLLATLAQEPLATPDALCDAIGDALWRIPDNHLAALIGDRVCGQERRQQRKARVGPNLAPRSESDPPWRVSSAKLGERQIPVLSLTRFPASEDDSWKGYSAALRELMESPALIVDLRGNWGGDDSRGIELAEALLGHPPEAYFDAIISRQDPSTFALLLNPALLAERSLKRRRAAVPRFVRDNIKEYRQLYKRALQGKLPAERVFKPSASPARSRTTPYPHPVLVLADAECASSCEGTLLYLMQHPKVLAIGERTAGYVHFGDVGTLVLPNSQILVSIPTKYFQIGGAYYERVGIQPGLESSGDALQTALSWLSENLPE